MGAHPEALGAEGGDGLVEDLAAAAHDGDLRAVARELGGDLEADAGSPAGDQRRLALEHVRPERRLHRLGSDLARAGVCPNGEWGRGPKEHSAVGGCGRPLPVLFIILHTTVHGATPRHRDSDGVDLLPRVLQARAKEADSPKAIRMVWRWDLRRPAAAGLRRRVATYPFIRETPLTAIRLGATPSVKYRIQIYI